MKVFNLQMSSQPDVDANLSIVAAKFHKHAEDIKGNIVVLPECFAFFGGRDKENLGIAEFSGTGKIQDALKQLAQQYSLFLVAGSIPIVGNDKNKFKNVCLVFNPNGQEIASYQKIHLFDVTVADGTRHYRESDTAEAGGEIVTFEANGVVVGVAICYDLRFPGLFENLRDRGVHLVVLPSAFTAKTGAAHWHTLVKSRTIENQFYMAACNQTGVHQNNRETYGHSIIVDPWGDVLVDAKQTVGITGVELDLTRLETVRKQMPVAQHNRFKSTLIDE